MLVARQEIFGPVLAVMRFEDDEQALEIANSGDYGLAAGVWTQSIGRAHRAIEHLQTGVVWVNTYRSSAAQAPFGGVKGSGYGRERGEDGIEDYTYVQNVMIDYSEDERDPFSVRV
jgi:aldehyde dehydrogenase (NAD+)